MPCVGCGGARPSQAIIDERRVVCDTCPNLVDTWEGPVCQACGCALYSKTQAVVPSCPLGRWAR